MGSVAEFGFNGHAVVLRMRIEELDPPRRVAWHCVGGNPEWEGTSVTFDLRNADGSTVLDFAHREWRSTGGIYAMCNFDWARYLLSLKSYLETGTGDPHPG